MADETADSLGQAYVGVRMSFSDMEGDLRQLESTLQPRLNQIGKDVADVAQSFAKLPAPLPPMPQETASWWDRINEKFQLTAVSSEFLAGAAGGLAVAFGGAILGALGSLVGRLGDFVMGAIQAGSALADMSAKTGLTTQYLQELEQIGAQTGVSIDTLTNAAFELGRRIAGGDESVVSGLSELGLEYQAIANLSPQDQFDTVAQALSNVADTAERNRIGSEIMGRSFKSVAQAMSSDWNDLKAGTIKTSDEAIKALDRIDDAIARSELAAKTIVTNVVGYAAELGLGFYDAAAGVFQWTKSVWDGTTVSGVFGNVMRANAAAVQASAGATADHTKKTTDYVAVLAEAQRKVANLTDDQLAQLDALEKLGKNTDDIAKALGISTDAAKLADQQWKANQETLKKTAEEAKKHTDALDRVASATVEVMDVTADQILVLKDAKVSESDIAAALGVTETQVRKVLDAEKDRLKQAEDMQKSAAIVKDLWTTTYGAIGDEALVTLSKELAANQKWYDDQVATLDKLKVTDDQRADHLDALREARAVKDKKALDDQAAREDQFKDDSNKLWTDHYLYIDGKAGDDTAAKIKAVDDWQTAEKKKLDLNTNVTWPEYYDRLNAIDVTAEDKKQKIIDDRAKKEKKSRDDIQDIYDASNEIIYNRLHNAKERELQAVKDNLREQLEALDATDPHYREHYDALVTLAATKAADIAAAYKEKAIDKMVGYTLELVDGADQGWKGVKDVAMRQLGELLKYIEETFVRSIIAWATGSGGFLKTWTDAFSTIGDLFGGFRGTASTVVGLADEAGSHWASAGQAAVDAARAAGTASETAISSAGAASTAWTTVGTIIGIATAALLAWYVYQRGPEGDPDARIQADVAEAQRRYDAIEAMGENPWQFNDGYNDFTIFVGQNPQVIGRGRGFREGGIALEPTLGIFGEAGPEALVPLDRYNEQMLGVADRAGAGGPLTVQIYLDTTMIAEEVMQKHPELVRLYGVPA